MKNKVNENYDVILHSSQMMERSINICISSPTYYKDKREESKNGI